MDWININDRLPLKQFPGELIVGKFLVTVHPKDLDSNDDPSVLILWFHAGSNFFSHTPGGNPYEDKHDHFVSHWCELPEPAQL